MWSYLVLSFTFGVVFWLLIQFLIIGLFKFFTYSWVSFHNLCLSRNIGSRLSNCHNCSYYSFIIFYVFVRSVVISPFISRFSHLNLLSYFLVSLAKGLSILVILSKKQLLVSFIFTIIFLFQTIFWESLKSTEYSPDPRNLWSLWIQVSPTLCTPASWVQWYLEGHLGSANGIINDTKVANRKWKDFIPAAHKHICW